MHISSRAPHRKTRPKQPGPPVVNFSSKSTATVTTTGVLLAASHRSLVALHALLVALHLTGCRRALDTATCMLLAVLHRSLVAHHALLAAWQAGEHLSQQPACCLLSCIEVLLHFTHIFFWDLTMFATGLIGVRPSKLGSYSHHKTRLRFSAEKSLLASKRFFSKRLFSDREESKLKVTTTVPPHPETAPLWPLRLSESVRKFSNCTVLEFLSFFLSFFFFFCSCS